MLLDDGTSPDDTVEDSREGGDAGLDPPPGANTAVGEYAPEPPPGRSFIHHLLNEDRAVFISLDLETGGETAASYNYWQRLLQWR